MSNDKTLFAMDLTAKMAVEQIAQETNQSQEKVLLDFMKSNTAKMLYDDATKQNTYGYAGVKKDGKWGAIDNKGNLIQEPTYNLEDYLKIDFIGRWHLGKDLNMNYYNQL